MGLTTWQDAPEGKIRKSDVSVAKNYLMEPELAQLNRMVTAYLDFAENMALRKIPLTMADWEKRLNSFIEMFEYGLLKDAGKVTTEIAKIHAETEFEKYRVIQDKLFLSDYDRYLLELEAKAEEQDIVLKNLFNSSDLSQTISSNTHLHAIGDSKIPHSNKNQKQTEKPRSPES